MFSTQIMASFFVSANTPKSQSDFSRSMNLKRILFVASLLLVAGTTQAAVVVSGGLVAGPNAISTTDCALLASPVSVTLSTGNIGAYQCNALSANIVLAVASTSGKNKVFSVSSEGGAITAAEIRSSPTAADLELSAASSVGGGVTTEQAQSNNGGNTSVDR